MYTDSLNLETTIKISGVEHKLIIIDINKGIITTFKIDDNFYNLEQTPGIDEQKPVIPRFRTDKWTTEEDQILMKNYIKKSVRIIVEENLLPGRNANAIYNRLNALNLTKYKDRKPRKIKNASKDFNQKILSKEYHNVVYEQCFNYLVFRLESKEEFRNKDIRKLIKDWYKDVLNQDLKDSVIHNYENSYLKYGVDQGFFEKIKNGLFKVPKIAKTIEEPETTKDDPVKGFTEHKEMRIREIRENEKKFLKEHKYETTEETS